MRGHPAPRPVLSLRGLDAGGGGLGRPLVQNTTGLGAADIALREIVEGALDFELLTPLPEGEGASPKKKKKKS